MPALTIDSPVGSLTLVEEDDFLVEVNWGGKTRNDRTSLLCSIKADLWGYFEGWHDPPYLPVAPEGTEFERDVWAAMCRIPRGETRTYGEIAKAIAADARDVGQACGHNPIPIVIPCHRVAAASGKLGGYSGKGGAQTKRFLLGLEARPLGIPRGLICTSYFSIPKPGSRVRPLRVDRTNDLEREREQGCLTFR